MIGRPFQTCRVKIMGEVLTFSIYRILILLFSLIEIASKFIKY